MKDTIKKQLAQQVMNKNGELVDATLAYLESIAKEVDHLDFKALWALVKRDGLSATIDRVFVKMFIEDIHSCPKRIHRL